MDPKETRSENLASEVHRGAFSAAGLSRAPVALVALGRSGIVRDANACACAMLDVEDAQAIVGRGLLGMLDTPEEAARAFADHLRRLARGESPRTEIRVRTRAGRRLDIELASALLDEETDEAPTVILETAERKRLEAQTLFLELAGQYFARVATPEAVLEQTARVAVPLMADLCILELHREGRVARRVVAHANAAAAAALRANDTPLVELAGIGVAVQAALTTQQPVAVERFVASPGADPTEARDPVFVRSLGVRSIVAAPLVSRGTVLGAMLLGSTGERASATDVLLAEELARRASLAIDNGVLFRELYDASQSKDRFIGVLSHELRTPLAPVLMAVTALRRTGLDDKAEIERVLAMVERNVELEARLIDDILEVSRVTHGKFELQLMEVDVHRAIDQVLEICRREAAERGLEVTVHLDAPRYRVNADPARVQQILWNLFKNAVKFTDPGGKITIRTRQDQSVILVQVEDSGVGIEPHQLSRIFDAFAQAEPSISRRYGGVGLGLAISRTLAQAQGGWLVASSAGLGKGSAFELALPLAEEGSTQSEEAGGAASADLGESRPPSRPVHVLLVEDDHDMLDTTSELLEMSGWLVTRAASLAAALEQASTQAFDVVVSDIGLPDGSGLDLMRALRSRSRGLRGIALSGYGTGDDVERSRRAGFARHLTKPVSYAALEEALHDLTC